MNAVQGTRLIIHQMTELLAQLEQDVYTRPLALFHGSTVGQHFRHILEFYTCLLEGIDGAQVDYSSRKRNLVLSENTAAAVAVLEYVAASIGQLDEQLPLRIESEFSENEAEAERLFYTSSLGRELQYAFDHAVHHLAIIRMGIQTHFPEVPIDPQLGVAPSTLKYQKTLLPASVFKSQH